MPLRAQGEVALHCKTINVFRLHCQCFSDFLIISHLWYLPQSPNKPNSTKDKSKDKKKKSAPELVQDAPLRRILGSVHIPLQSLVKGSQKVNILCDLGALHKESEVEATQTLEKASQHTRQVFTQPGCCRGIIITWSSHLELETILKQNLLYNVKKFEAECKKYIKLATQWTRLQADKVTFSPGICFSPIFRTWERKSKRTRNQSWEKSVVQNRKTQHLQKVNYWETFYIWEIVCVLCDSSFFLVCLIF